MSENLTFLERVMAVQAELKSPKNNKNSYGNYNYRSVEDILEVLKPLCVKYKLLLFLTDEVEYSTVERTTKYTSSPEAVKKGAHKDYEYHESGKELIIAYAKILDATDPQTMIEAKGVAPIDWEQKGMASSQRSGSSSSYARKKALGGLFLIDDSKDADATNNHGRIKLTEGDDNWNQLVNYIKNQNGSVKNIENSGRYVITPTQKSKLLKLEKNGNSN